MPYVVVTRLRLSRLRHLPRFLSLSKRIREQLATADGLLDFRVSGFTTVSLWDSIDAIHAFRSSGAHKEAMAQTRRITRWVIADRFDGDALPSHDEARARLARIQKERRLNASIWTGL